jgi:tetratricopeptide (TPR) repeat protein
MYVVYDRTLCEPCADADLEARNLPQVPPGAVRRLGDPTICGHCRTDQGQQELPSIAGIPACPACEQRLRNPRLPGWVRAAGLAILVLAGVELARNWRLFQGYFEIPRAHRAAKAGNFDEAARQMALAAGHLPELSPLTVHRWFYQGMAQLTKNQFDQAAESFEKAGQEAGKAGGFDKESRDALEEWLTIAKVRGLLEKDRNVDALALGEEFKRKFPSNTSADAMINAAGIAVAFEGKDYVKFEKLARERLSDDPKDPFTIAQLASALSCRYVETGQESFKTEAMETLDKARKLSGGNDSFKEYEERILHRLKTREVIDKKEYDRRFRSDGKGQAE